MYLCLWSQICNCQKKFYPRLGSQTFLMQSCSKTRSLIDFWSSCLLFTSLHNFSNFSWSDGVADFGKHLIGIGLILWKYPPIDAWFLMIVPIMRHLQSFWDGNGLWVVGYFLNSCNILEMWNWKQMCTYVVSNYIILIICSMLSFDLHTSKFEWYWGKSCT